MIVLRDLSKSFDNGKSLAVHPLSLEVEDGETMVLLGSSGSGKTTILKMINYLPPADPEKLWTSPYMFQFGPLNPSDGVLARITESASRETFWITVDNTNQLSAGQWITLYMNSPAAVGEFLAPYQPERTWTTIRNRGVQIREKHSIAEIQGNRIRRCNYGR